ncbi:MAG: hypothetical protein HC804_05210 [Anaerolineae bacterium]|nr:hypothetical protein [Anaerolineae bacterium]
MRPFYHRLTFKIGATIILVEFLVLSLVGFLLIRQFSRYFQEDIENRILLPAAIVSTNRANLDILADQGTVEQLVGAPIISAFISSNNNIIINAIDEQIIGRRISEMPELEVEWFTAVNAQGTMLRGKQDVTSIMPIFSSDGTRPLFFVYVQASTAQFQAEENGLVLVVVVSTLLVVGLTSLILYLAF